MLHKKKILFPLLLSLISLLPLGADAPAGTEGGEDLSVSLMIVGPGIPLYVWWGHIGLIVENAEEGWSYFYDFGNFSFEEDHFYRNFAMGRLYYLKIKSRTESYLRYLTWFDRRVTIYKLNLTPEERETVYYGLEEGVRPENRTYLYHHYEDNCSTRIRDALDDAMGGELRDSTREYAQSFRDQSNRFVRPFWPYFLLNYLQGPSVDETIEKWDALFLPEELEKTVLAHKRPDGLPLVREVIRYQEGLDPPIPETPFPRGADAFLWGMLLFFLTLFIRAGSFERTAAFWRVFCVLITAVPGLFLCFMMFFTDHYVTRGNLNALITCPLLIIALIPAFRYDRRAKAPRRYERLWDFQAFLVILSLLFKLLPGVAQDNGAVLFLYYPLILAHGTAGTALVRYLTPSRRVYPWSRK